MIDADVLDEGDAVELLEGWIVPKMPRNPPHDATIGLADDALRTRLPAGWHVRLQSAITTSDSEPEPDLAIVRGSVRQYTRHHPGPQDIALVVEVADSSLARDRDDKGRLYARADIATYWIINLVDLIVEVYTDPDAATEEASYRRRDDYSPGQSVPFRIAAGTPSLIPVEDLLP